MNPGQGVNRSSSPTQTMNGHSVKKSRDDLQVNSEVTNGHGKLHITARGRSKARLERT